MGIYGHKFDALIESRKPVTVEESTTSLVYEECLNRINLLEACTDENKRLLLESQIEVLYEVSIKEVLTKFKNWIKKQLLKLINFLERLFSKGKQTKFKDSILRMLNRAKKNLSDVEEAETKEDLEKCGSEFKKEKEEFDDEVDSLLKELDETISEMEQKGVDKETINNLKEFYKTAKDVNEGYKKDENFDVDKGIKDMDTAYDKYKSESDKIKANKVIDFFSKKLKDPESVTKNMKKAEDLVNNTK